MKLEMELARTMLGKSLNQDCKRRLLAVVENPTQETWEQAYSIILRGVGMGMTLWQGIVALDSSYANIGKRMDLHGNILSPWKKIPPSDLIIRAIKYLTH